MATQPVPPGLNVTRYQGDLSNPDVATAQTVEVMCEQIQKAAQDPLVTKAARDAVNRFRGGPLYASAGINPWRNQHAQAESVWWWCKHVLKFAHHDGMIAVYFNEFDQLQLLISPDLLLRMSDPRGDCAIYTMLECAMLQALGIDSEIVTSAVDPFAPDVFSHVYPRAVMSSGRRLVLDASHGKYPGWEVPTAHTLRKQVWDLQGNRIPDQAPRFKGLHGYTALARPKTPILPKRLAMVPGIGLSGYIRANRGLGRLRNRGLGQDETTLSPGVDTSNIPVTNPPGGYPITSPASAPNPFTSALAATLPGVIGSGMTILGNVVAPQVMYRGPGGVMYSAPAGSTGGGIPFLPGKAAGSYFPLLLLGGGLLVVFLMMGRK